MIQGSLNIVSPTVVVKNSAGQVVPDGGAVGQNISVEVTGSGEGIAALEVTRGKRLLDRAREVFDGSGEYIFVDPSPKGQSFTYTADLSAVPEGERIYVQAVDGSGGISVQSFLGQLLLTAVGDSGNAVSRYGKPARCPDGWSPGHSPDFGSTCCSAVGMHAFFLPVFNDYVPPAEAVRRDGSAHGPL